jgi:nitroreductase
MQREGSCGAGAFSYFYRMAETSKAIMFDAIVKARRSVRIYDAAAPFDSEAVKRSIERAVLSANSSNMQLWEFYLIRSEEAKKKVAAICLGQNAARTAREMVVIVIRPDLFRQRAKFNYDIIKATQANRISLGKVSTLDYYKKLMPMLYFNDPLGLWGFIKKTSMFFAGLSRPVVREVNGTDMRIVMHKSAALAAQTFMLSMKAEGYDTCPMEGFDSGRLKRFLKLPRRAEINMVIAAGPGTPEGIYGERIRVRNSEIIFEV